MKKLGLYVHIPFCVSKCNYCDFASYSGCGNQDFEAYKNAILNEIKSYSKNIYVNNGANFDPSDYLVDSIFIGGGTPSLFPLEMMDEIITLICCNFNISDDVEFTMEANPKTLSFAALEKYLEMKINRLSMGAQSFDDSILKLLGRIHSANDFKENFQMARTAGFKNINFDLIFGIPNQSFDSWADTISQALLLNPEHLSIYNLKIEEGTPFYDKLKTGQIIEIDDSLDRKMYHSAISRLKKESNYDQYEISNFSKIGFECRHNLKYWSMEEYLGIGLNSHSYINQVRSSNITDLHTYNNTTENFKIWEHINKYEDEVSEYIFTNMRKTCGLSISDFQSRFNKSFVDIFSQEITKLKKEKLVEFNSDYFKLTTRGVDISNYVLSHFV